MVYMLLADGFEEIEAIAPLDILRRAEIEAGTVSLTSDLYVRGGHDIIVKADIALEQIDFASMEVLVLPGGGVGVDTISGNPEAMDLIMQTWIAGKKIAAICAAPALLATLNILDGRDVICHPSVTDEVAAAGGKVQEGHMVVFDHNLVTGIAAGASIDFGLGLVSALRGKEASELLRGKLSP